MKENGKLSKDLYNKNMELERFMKEINEFRMENGEYSAVMKEKDKRIN